MAVFGYIFLLTLTSEEFIVPVLSEAHGQLSSMVDKALIWPRPSACSCSRSW